MEAARHQSTVTRWSRCLGRDLKIGQSLLFVWLFFSFFDSFFAREEPRRKGAAAGAHSSTSHHQLSIPSSYFFFFTLLFFFYLSGRAQRLAQLPRAVVPLLIFITQRHHLQDFYTFSLSGGIFFFFILAALFFYPHYLLSGSLFRRPFFREKWERK